MSFRKIFLNLLIGWLAFTGIVCGLLSLACLILYLLWQGLNVSIIALALVCLFCLASAIILSGWVSTKYKAADPGSEQVGSLKARLFAMTNDRDRNAKAERLSRLVDESRNASPRMSTGGERDDLFQDIGGHDHPEGRQRR